MRNFWATLSIALLFSISVLATPFNTASLDTPSYELISGATAISVFTIILLLALFIKKIDLHTHSSSQWIVGGVSLFLALFPQILLSNGLSAAATWIYRGLHLPIGQVPFWDLTLVLQSVDCARWGFDVFTTNNGCLAEPSIYAPGSLWLGWIPFIFSAANAYVLGITGIIVASLSLIWLAKHSQGLGQLTLLVAAAGGPWLLLLERGNLDLGVFVAAILVSAIAIKFNNYAIWSIVALIIWFVGSWKYYPFALGVLLLPVILLRRGWIILITWISAVLVYVYWTWENLQLSNSANSNMVDLNDYVTLGRLPILSRFSLSTDILTGFNLGNIFFFAIFISALIWGVSSKRNAIQSNEIIDASLGKNSDKKYLFFFSALAIAGSLIFLASVFFAGFGWAYKAVFLLLCVPLLSHAKLTGRSFEPLIMLGFIAISSIVVWNVLLASISGIVAGAFTLGIASTILYKLLLDGKRNSKARS